MNINKNSRKSSSLTILNETDTEVFVTYKGVEFFIGQAANEKYLTSRKNGGKWNMFQKYFVTANDCIKHIRETVDLEQEQSRALDCFVALQRAANQIKVTRRSAGNYLAELHGFKFSITITGFNMWRVTGWNIPEVGERVFLTMRECKQAIQEIVRSAGGE